MHILIAGASGATGQHLVRQLLASGHHVKAIVRSQEKFTNKIGEHPQLTVLEASILTMSNNDLADHVKGCDAVVSCLGHNLTMKGIWGQPRKLVTDAVRKLCKAIRANAPVHPVKFVLMNTVGNRNRNLEEHRSIPERMVIALLRLLVPPHPDNEQAAEFLRTEVGQSNREIEWVVVRPDTLLSHETVTEYTIHPSPVRSALFNPGKTSRINVAHFMAELITNGAWEHWKGQMPVIYNSQEH